MLKPILAATLVVVVALGPAVGTSRAMLGRDTIQSGTLEFASQTRHRADSTAASFCMRPTLSYQGTQAGALKAVVAITARDVWAVGLDGDFAVGSGFAMHWNGTRWRQVPTPNTGGHVRFFSITAGSSRDVWVVGDAALHPLIEHWDGTRWQLMPGVFGGGYGKLSGVAAVSASDVWAVGDSYRPGGARTLVEHWDGRRWSEVPTGLGVGTYLSAVAAGSARDVWAVGRDYYGATLVEHWDGSGWRRVPSPMGRTTTDLYGVAVISPTDTWAVGYSQDAWTPARTFLIHWDGTGWRAVPDATRGADYKGLTGVAAASAQDVWAVGGGVEHWDGHRWRFVSSLTNGEQAITAVAPGDVWAVGIQRSSNLPTAILVPAVEHFVAVPCSTV